MTSLAGCCRIIDLNFEDAMSYLPHGPLSSVALWTQIEGDTENVTMIASNIHSRSIRYKNYNKQHDAQLSHSVVSFARGQRHFAGGFAVSPSPWLTHKT